MVVQSDARKVALMGLKGKSTGSEGVKISWVTGSYGCCHIPNRTWA